MNSNLNDDTRKAEAMYSEGHGMPTEVGFGNSKVFRYENLDTVKKHIKKLVQIGGSAKVIHGVES